MDEKLMEKLTDAIMRIAQGPTMGPTAAPGGLEAVAMNLAGDQADSDSVAAGLHDVATAIRELAEALAALNEANQ